MCSRRTSDGPRPSPGRGWPRSRPARRLAKLLVTPHVDATKMRANELQALVRLGETAGVEATLAAMDPSERATGEMRNVLAALALAKEDPRAATATLAPVTDGSVTGVHPIWLTEALLLEAIAHDALGDAAAAGRTLERALDLAEPDALLLPLLLDPALGLLKRHSRQCAAHEAFVSQSPGPARPNEEAGGTARGGVPPAQAAQRRRDPGPALPADQPVGARDHRRNVSIDEYRPDAHAPHLRKAWRTSPPQRRRAGPRPGPVRTVAAQDVSVQRAVR